MCQFTRRTRLANYRSLLVGESVIDPTISVRNLGVQLRSDLMINDQISTVVRSCNYNIRQLRAIRSSLSRYALRDVAYDLVLSRLDYFNVLYANAPVTQIKRLQMVINMTARVVSGRRRFDLITDFISSELHWLPVLQCVQLKIGIMVFKAMNNLSPVYIADLILSSTITRRRDLRSSSQQVLLVPRHRTQFATRAFAVAGPITWNLFPIDVRIPTKIMTFRMCLKEHLFKTAYEH